MTDKNQKEKPHYSKSLKWQLKTLIPVFWIFVAIFVYVSLQYWIFG
ncbi:hypothetical protein [Candidatus Pelagibacter sp.]